MNAFSRLVRLMARLRRPRTGCPWDLKQTENTLKEYILEEAHELLEAIESRAPERIKEELGDLLLQIVFLARIAQEKKQFGIRDVIATINRKLVNRHPHIFGRAKAHTPEEVKANWERIKMVEKEKTSILSDYPEHMPALLTAHRLASQAGSVGFDWDDARQALAKVEEEIAELELELKKRRSDRAEQEIGDLLFAVANVARLLKINPEFALNQTNKKFGQRFRFIEKELKKRGKDIRHSTLQEMEALWQQSKKN